MAELPTEKQPFNRYAKDCLGGRFRDEVQVTDALERASQTRSVGYKEVMEQLERKGRLRRVVVETHPSEDGVSSVYALFLECSWYTKQLRILIISGPARPRFYRDLDRLLAMIRNDFSYKGTVEVTMKSNRKAKKATQ
jgi:hypothetical protein